MADNGEGAVFVPKKRRTDVDLLKRSAAELRPWEVAPSLVAAMDAAISEGQSLPPLPGNGTYKVLKFGGSSVGTPTRINQVLDVICKELDKPVVSINDKNGSTLSQSSTVIIAVVVSAMGNTTDWLIDAADLASSGDVDTANLMIDKVADLATTNGLMCGLTNKDNVTSVSRGITEFTSLVREFLAPLRQLLQGMSLLREKTPQALDAVLSFGERLSAIVISELLIYRSRSALFIDARTWVVTNNQFGGARVDMTESFEKLNHIRRSWGSRVPVVTGFIGATHDGRTTTLGRNGSDYTATLLGAGLQAASVIINTDVPGVMTADPNIVPDAYPVSELTYAEAVELAVYGSRMFHPRTMLPLIESEVPMVIRNTMDPNGFFTRISKAGRTVSNENPTCVTSLENLALVDIRLRKLGTQTPLGRRALCALDEAGVTVWMAIQAAHGQAIAVVTPLDQVAISQKALTTEFEKELSRGELDPVVVKEPVTMLSLVAERVSSARNVCGRFFQSLGQAGVNTIAIAQGSQSRSVSCIINARDTNVAVRAVHDVFNFSHQVCSLFLVAGGDHSAREVCSLTKQIEKQIGLLERGRHVVLRTVGLVIGSTVFEFKGTGATAAEISSIIDNANRISGSPISTLVSHPTVIDSLSRRPVPILVDCSGMSSSETSVLYSRCFDAGIHVVASNANSVVELPLELFNHAIAFNSALSKPCENHEIQRTLTPSILPQSSPLSLLSRHTDVGRGILMFDSAAGASLPILELLRNICRTGDRVMKIEAVLSGSISFILDELFNASVAGVHLSLSACIRRAVDEHLMEEHPHDDLSGLDTARKLCLLTRQAGFPLSLGDVSITPLIPHCYLQADCMDRSCQENHFMKSSVNENQTYASLFDGIDAYSPSFQQCYHSSFINGSRLVYLATVIIDDTGVVTTSTVSPVLIKKDDRHPHPAYQLRGKETYVSLTSERYRDHPMVLMGAGSGSDVGAAGVLNDVVKIAQGLRGL